MLVGVDETEGAWRGVNIFGNDAVLSDFLQHYDHVLPLVLGLGNQVQVFLWERQVVEFSQHQMEETGKVVEILSEAYMGTSRLEREDLETKEDEVWP